MSSEFSNGSGGWNDFSAEILLDVFSNALLMIKTAIKTSKENSLTLFNLIDEKLNILQKVYIINKAIADLEKIERRSQFKK